MNGLKIACGAKNGACLKSILSGLGPASFGGYGGLLGRLFLMPSAFFGPEQVAEAANRVKN